MAGGFVGLVDFTGIPVGIGVEAVDPGSFSVRTARGGGPSARHYDRWCKHLDEAARERRKRKRKALARLDETIARAVEGIEGAPAVVVAAQAAHKAIAAARKSSSVETLRTQLAVLADLLTAAEAEAASQDEEDLFILLGTAFDAVEDVAEICDDDEDDVELLLIGSTTPG